MEDGKVCPTINRIVKSNGRNVSLKISIGKKKLQGQGEGLGRLMYSVMVINGAQYCRPHLKTRCQLCTVDHHTLNEEINEERRQLNLRPCGDAALNGSADEWRDFIVEKTMMLQLTRDLLIQKYGRDHHITHPQHWKKWCRDADESELEINDKYLAMKVETSQCAYWACDTPNAPNLKLCMGCKIVKYCCKEHQAKDWVWEHQGECQLPQFFINEMQEDRARHLAGDYREIKRD
jgi:hypothetical protein